MLFFGFGSLRARLLMMSIAFIGTGAWMYAPTWNAREQVDCNLAQLYYGKLPKSNWVKVSGRLLWDAAATEEKRGSIRAYFVPLVPGSWHDGQPVQVIVRISKYEAEAMEDATVVEGLIQPLGLPFDLQLAFSGDDGPQAGENVVYIHHGTNPNSQRRFAQVVLGIGFAGLAGFVVLWKTGKGDSETTYHSLAKPRDLNEAVSRTAEEDLEHQAREVQRESEIDRWMRERGLKKPEAEKEPAAEERQVAASR